MRTTFYALLCLSLLGCSRALNRDIVKVDAVALSNTFIPTTFFIKPLNSKKDKLKFRRVSQKLANILIERGFIESSLEDSANQIIYFDYGVETISIKREVYQTPNISIGFSFGFPFHANRRRFYNHIFLNDIWYNGYRRYIKSYELYKKYIVIVAQGRAKKELWRVDVESVGDKRDIDNILDTLLNIAFKYIGKNLDKALVIDIDDNLTKK
jgi:hypothetical protein